MRGKDGKREKNREERRQSQMRIEDRNNTQYTSSTKTRSEVSGGGRKPWKQKGTGRARAGSNRSPLWRGGGLYLDQKQKK